MTDLSTIDWRNEPGEEGVVTRVDKSSITLDSSWGCSWPKDAGPMPRVGDRVKIVGEMGHEFYGMVLNHRLVWWLTPAEREQRRADWLREYHERQERDFVAAEARLDADYDALPRPFRFRIDQLRAAGGRAWRVESESYEMFVCKEAVKMAEHFRTREALAAWKDLSYEDQRAAWDGYDDGHSGNTFGCALMLAALWCDAGLSDQAEALVVQPQAISPIAGDPRYASR